METLPAYCLIIMTTLYSTFCGSSTPCVDSCLGLEDGNYQHCQDCQHYVACSNSLKYVMPCPSNLVWHDGMKRCEYTSPTCTSTRTDRITSIIQPLNGKGYIYSMNIKVSFTISMHVKIISYCSGQ
ncbi:hypothetical protein ACJMK2_024706 [Sinanodonta woodiana]|uniref:Chitin-binding type-2 domain-containing protein n=1 Tax=Sinanodonta woodiana TaxID=1069815 RepID=A0ABD3XE67_SINWO